MRTYSEKVITALLEGKNDKEVAEMTGLSRRTIYRYKRDPELQDILQQRRTAMVQEAVQKMRAGLDEAVGMLQRIFRDPDIAPQVRVNAINVFCTQYRALTENADFTARLEDAESAMDDL